MHPREPTTQQSIQSKIYSILSIQSYTHPTAEAADVLCLITQRQQQPVIQGVQKLPTCSSQTEYQNPEFCSNPIPLSHKQYLHRSSPFPLFASLYPTFASTYFFDIDLTDF